MVCLYHSSGFAQKGKALPKINHPIFVIPAQAGTFRSVRISAAGA
jgi:hypothetical protein